MKPTELKPVIAALTLTLMLPTFTHARAFANDTSATAVGANAVDIKPYRLEVDDQLDISIMGHDEFHSLVTILPDGTFNYPLIGSVHAAGLTVQELTKVITRGVSGQLNTPQVTVSVRSGSVGKVSVLGSVKNSGIFDYKPGWRLLDALAASGGAAQAPELTQATLVTSGGTKSIPIDFDALMNGADASHNLQLKPGDVLIVQQRDPSLAQVQIIGEVVKPGAYTVPPNGASVLSVLAQAGGATPKAALTHAQLMHAGKVLQLNLRPLMNRLDDNAANVRLSAGDVLLIPTNNAQFAVLGEVKNPSDYDIPDGGKASVTTALSDAGGITTEGNKSGVTILRLSPTGKPTVIAANLDSLLKGDSGSVDTQIEAGDIVFVPTRKKSDFRPTDFLSLIPILTLFRR